MRTLLRLSRTRSLVLSLGCCIAAAGAHAASITYTITVNTSVGASYSGSVTTASALLIGQSTPITLSEVGSAQFSPTSLSETLSIGSGPNGFNSVFISPIVFTDTISSLMFDLIVVGAAHCDTSVDPTGVPCETGGILTAGNANGGSGSYFVSAEPAVPEPSYTWALLTIGVLCAFIRRRAHA